MYHYRKTRKAYVEKRAAAGCPFCDDNLRTRTIRETKHARLIPNLTFYDVWELGDVLDHLMVVPKRNVESLQELSAAERADIMDLLAEYESKGYDVYARAWGSTMKSVSHQHTHLIKTKSKRARFLLFLERPYFLLKR